MSHKNVEANLTPAAKQILDEILAEYKLRIIMGAEDLSSPLSRGMQEISASDILLSLNKNSESRTRSTRSKLSRIFLSYMGAGILMLFGGLVFFLVREITKFSNENKIALLISLGGFIIASLSAAMLYSFRYRKNGINDLFSEKDSYKSKYIPVFDDWNAIEYSIRNKATQLFGESYSSKPIKILVEEFERNQFLNKEDVSNIYKILKYRNKLAHGSSDISDNERKIINAYYNKTINALNKIKISNWK